MKALFTCVLMILTANLTGPVLAALPEVITTEAGFIRGKNSQDLVQAFLGVPYAAPPVGSLRWKPPRPVSHWTKTRSAQTFAPACLQPWSESTLQSEDCLYLNIWTPATSAKEALPVMVWIHGGGFTFGSGASSENQGQILARRGVIVVTINYRLGVFGFLGHEWLSTETNQKVSGNYGLLDQIEALKWVQRNIARFGGNPKNVTIFGVSAGGTSVAALMSSPLASGLFHKAIAQSGYAAMLRSLKMTPQAELKSLEEIGEKVAEVLGCSQSGDVARCLRSLSPSTILGKIYADGINLPQLSPVKDGHVLPDSPLMVFRRGEQLKVPTIVGVMKNEVIRDPSLQNLKTIESYKSFLSSCFPGNSDAVFEKFPATRDDEVFTQVEQVLTDLLATMAARRMAVSMIHQAAPTFVYQFTRVPPFAEEQGWGSFHGLDVSYLFQSDMTKPNFDDLDFAVSESVQTLWTNFARTGTPSFAEGWPEFNLRTQSYLEIGDRLVVKDGLERERLDLLERIPKGECVIP